MFELIAFILVYCAITETHNYNYGTCQIDMLYSQNAVLYNLWIIKLCCMDLANNLGYYGTYFHLC